MNRILVVEDEKPMARALELKLKKEGFDVKSVVDGESALSLVKKKRFDLILLDLVIPRLDGFGVLGALKEERNSPPVIVLTNLSQTEDRDRAIKLGAKDFFVKSNTTIAQIVERVRELLK